MTFLLALFLLALGSSFISGVCGMAGGVTLMAGLTFFLPYHIIVPIHGAAQLVSNISRTFYLRKKVNHWVMWAFVVATPIGAAAAFLLLKHLPSFEFAYVIIALLLFYVALRPESLPEIRLGRSGFAAIASSFVRSFGSVLDDRSFRSSSSD